MAPTISGKRKPPNALCDSGGRLQHHTPAPQQIRQHSATAISPMDSDGIGWATLSTLCCPDAPPHLPSDAWKQERGEREREREREREKERERETERKREQARVRRAEEVEREREREWASRSGNVSTPLQPICFSELHSCNFHSPANWGCCNAFHAKIYRFR